MDPSSTIDIDERTLAAARRGDRRALRRIHDGLAPRLLGYARGQGVEDPDVVANESLFRALRGLDGFDGDGQAFRSWVFTIAHNLIIDDRRRRARRPITVDLGLAPERLDRSPSPSVADTVVDRLEAEEMIRWIGDLVPDQRSVVLLRLVIDLPIAEVAAIVGKRPGAVKALQRRGLASLRRRMEAEGVSPGSPSTFTPVP